MNKEVELRNKLKRIVHNDKNAGDKAYYISRELQEVLYNACLASAKQMGPDKLKQMSWFGKNHK